MKRLSDDMLFVPLRYFKTVDKYNDLSLFSCCIYICVCMCVFQFVKKNVIHYKRKVHLKKTLYRIIKIPTSYVPKKMKSDRACIIYKGRSPARKFQKL